MEAAAAATGPKEVKRINNGVDKRLNKPQQYLTATHKCTRP